MRMWKVDPSKMCRRHLLGEHVEMHMFVGTINKGYRIDGYIDRGLVEVGNIRQRHDELAEEMKSRGYQHKSPLPYFKGIEAGRVSILDNEYELSRRCRECQFKKPGSQIKPMEGFKMKLNAEVLKSITEKSVKEMIAILNHEPFFQGNPIKGKRHANKTVLAQIMVDRVLDAADRGVKIPEDIDLLVGKLTDASDVLTPVRKPEKKALVDRGPQQCECDNTHEQNKTVCRFCWNRGIRYETAEWNKGSTLPESVVPEKKPKKVKEPRITKKSICIDLVSHNGGATIEQMANACVAAGLGDLELNKKICRLWMSKLGFKVVRSEDGSYSKI